MDGAQDARCRAAFDVAELYLHCVRSYVPRPGRAVRYRAYVGGLEPSSEPIVEERLLVRQEDGTYSEAMEALRRTVGVSA
jgi:hypothetical protein